VSVFALGVLAHDEEGSIERMLASVVRQTRWRALPAERRQVVVYANGCSDATAARARAFALRHVGIEVVETAEKGKSQGWNALQTYLRRDAEWWFFADADVILHWRAAQWLVEAAPEHPEAVVLSSTMVSSARFVPSRYRGLFEAARTESERLKDRRRMVEARFYAIRRDVAEAIVLPPGLLNEDLYLSRLIGSDRIWRSERAKVFAREPSRVGDIVRYQVRTRIGSFQARRISGARTDSNKTAAAMAQRTRSYRRLSWKARLGKLAWIPFKLYVEWRARRVRPESIGGSFWMKIGSAKLQRKHARGKGVMTVMSAELRGTPLGAALSSPERLLEAPGVRFVKDHRRTAVAAVTMEGQEVFVKRFKPYAWYRRLEWMLAPSPARRCWQRSSELERAGFRVAPPLALAETRHHGLPADSYFVTASIEGALPAGRFWRERAALLPLSERRRLLVALAHELRRFHETGFYSTDANADNFLVRSEPEGAAEFFLVDLENVRRIGHVSRRRRVKNLVQLHRPVRGETGLRDRLRFLAAYTGEPLPRLAGWFGPITALDAKKESEYRARRRSSRRD
jgi:hypothetical protein